jgi:hypothetical protein
LRRVDVTELSADEDFGSLPIEAQDAGRGDDVGVADRLNGVDE